MTETGWTGEISDLLAAASWESRLELSPQERSQMAASTRTLERTLAAGRPVYGVTQGFGPLVCYRAHQSSTDQGIGLISHLAVGQGEPLPPDVTRFMLWLRLSGMKRGHSAVSVDFWLQLADLWNRGFTPVAPRHGTVSASGDLTPLAHAALALAGVGEAWSGSPTSGWTPRPARQVLADLGAEKCVWRAREALAFVNGSNASLARACYNHQSILVMARAAAALTGRIVSLLGANQQPYSQGLSQVRGQQGQLRAASWIREEFDAAATWRENRPLQEPYSLRCAPQVVGAVVDQLRAQEPLLLHEALGCTDNPITWQDQVLHGGNFHALPVALCSDQQALCLHQLAFLAERQVALLLNPQHNGGHPPMLTPSPGPESGLAGVQISASSFVAKIRQLAYPASLTALPTNLDNQDHVPMAMNGANTVAELIEFGWLVIGSLALAVNQLAHLEEEQPPSNTLWARLRARCSALDRDRPLAAEVRAAARLLEREMRQRRDLRWFTDPDEGFAVNGRHREPLTTEFVEKNGQTTAPAAARQSSDP